MARELKYLSAEHMLGILKQRALELEADLYAQVKERELALKLSLDQVVVTTETKISMFEAALADLDSQIESLEKPEEPPQQTPDRRTGSRKRK